MSDVTPNLVKFSQIMSLEVPRESGSNSAGMGLMALRTDCGYASDSDSTDDLNDTLDANDPLVLAALRNDGNLPDDWERPPVGMPRMDSWSDTSLTDRDDEHSEDKELSNLVSVWPSSPRSERDSREDQESRDLSDLHEDQLRRRTIKPTRSFLNLDTSAGSCFENFNPLPNQVLKNVRKDIAKMPANLDSVANENTCDDGSYDVKKKSWEDGQCSAPMLKRSESSGSYRKRSFKIMLPDNSSENGHPRRKRMRPTIKKTVSWSPTDGFTTLWERCDTEEDTDSD